MGLCDKFFGDKKNIILSQYEAIFDLIPVIMTINRFHTIFKKWSWFSFDYKFM